MIPGHGMIRKSKGIYFDPIGRETWHNVHPRSACAGEKCVVHNPSNHRMVHWRRHLRETGLVERLCEHGIGHPDPDSVAFFKRHGIDLSIHGCDGCGHDIA